MVEPKPTQNITDKITSPEILIQTLQDLVQRTQDNIDTGYYSIPIGIQPHYLNQQKLNLALYRITLNAAIHQYENLYGTKWTKYGT